MKLSHSLPPHAATDFLLREELEGWVDAGQLARLDLTFARDQPPPRTVQHLLREHAPTAGTHCGIVPISNLALANATIMNDNASHSHSHSHS